MMLAALKLTLSPSMASASCLAVSSQRSARAGEAANAANSVRIAASRTERRNDSPGVMWSPFGAIQAKGREERKGGCRVGNGTPDDPAYRMLNLPFRAKVLRTALPPISRL